MLYQDIEPMPPLYRDPIWPIWAVLGICMAAMCSLLTVVPGWNLLAMVPYALFLPWWLIRAHRRHKRWNRDLDAWTERMNAYYARPFEQRRKSMWS